MRRPAHLFIKPGFLCGLPWLAFLAGLACAVGAAAETKGGKNRAGVTSNSEEIVIKAAAGGRLITDFGYDVKQPGKAQAFDANDAKAIFKHDGFTCLRVPIWGDVNQPAHPAPGVVVGRFYAPVIQAMEFARAAKPDVMFFASKRLEGQKSWPDWTKDKDGVEPEKYVTLLTDYLAFMHRKGFRIDLLGIDNEGEYNDGNLTAKKHKAIVTSVKEFCEKKEIPTPKFIGPETFGPKKEWFEDLARINGKGTLDFAGTHYYPKFRNPSKLAAWTKEAPKVPLWHTELHWDAMPEPKDLIDEGEHAIATLFDCTDNGFTGFVWWGYTRKGVKGEVMSELSSTMVRSTPLEVDDGNPNMKYGALFSRAFRKGDTIVLWVVNNTGKSVRRDVKATGANLSAKPTLRCWTLQGDVTGGADPDGGYTFPPRSVTVVKFPVVGR
jgi:O-glycosyl hydrolase